MTVESQEKSEEILVEAAQNGHLESFGVLYKRYHSPMVALAYSLLADKNLAEDAAQEVFAKACSALPRLRRRDKFAAWLAAICRNVAHQMLRSRSKIKSLENRQPTEKPDIEGDCKDAIRRAVWQLRPSERELIVLRYYDGFSQAQMSKVLDISPSAVNGRLTRAKRKIAKYLKRNGFTGDDYERG